MAMRGMASDHDYNTQEKPEPSVGLTHCGPVTSYGDRDLGQHWLRYWFVAWRHQAITWTLTNDLWGDVA